MEDWIQFEKDDHQVKKERQKARELRKTLWWQNQVNGGLCHYCKKKFSLDELTMDHLVPLVRGGKSTKGNCVPCCKPCNNQKKFFTPADLIINQLKKNKEQSPHELD